MCKNQLITDSHKQPKTRHFYLRLTARIVIPCCRYWTATGIGQVLGLLKLRTDAEAEAPVLCPPDEKNWLVGKDPNAGKDWRREEKGTTEDEMVGWHHRLHGHEFEQTPCIGDGQGSPVGCGPWGRKESDTTEPLNWTELRSVICPKHRRFKVSTSWTPSIYMKSRMRDFPGDPTVRNPFSKAEGVGSANHEPTYHKAAKASCYN